MHVEIDMSGRVEETNRPTALALANGLERSILMSGKDKQTVICALKQEKQKWSATQIHVYLFATLLYLLLKEDAPRLSQIVVDVEHKGYEHRIKEHLLNLLLRSGIDLDPGALSFRYVGKKSPAHKLAFRVYKKIVRPDRAVTAEEVLAEFRQ